MICHGFDKLAMGFPRNGGVVFAGKRVTVRQDSALLQECQQKREEVSRELTFFCWCKEENTVCYALWCSDVVVMSRLHQSCSNYDWICAQILVLHCCLIIFAFFCPCIPHNAMPYRLMRHFLSSVFQPHVFNTGRCGCMDTSTVYRKQVVGNAVPIETTAYVVWLELTTLDHVVVYG